jgi:hypothetical protein
VDVELATSTGQAFGAALVINEGQQTLIRIGFGGYARIRNSTQLWAEEGEQMPGIVRYDTMIPFLPLSPVVLRTQDILVRGGRDFFIDVTVYDDNGDIVDITNATFIAQIRRYRYAKYSLVQMGFEITDGPGGIVRLHLDPIQTSFLVRCMARGVWDVEMQKDGIESTVIPESKVRVLPGISQGTIVGAGFGSGVGVGNDSA